ncbi:hypothetical protein CN152_34385, partial [Sinorhizobium meliloti]
RPSGRATPSLRDAPGDAPIQIDAVPKLIVAPQMNESDPKTFYGGAAKGYIDYPVLSARTDTSS